jgi:hypothetical protein
VSPSRTISPDLFRHVATATAIALLGIAPCALEAQGLRSAPATVALVVVVPPRPVAPLRDVRGIEQHAFGDGLFDVSTLVGFMGEDVSRVDVFVAGDPGSGVRELLGRSEHGRFVHLDGRTRLAVRPMSNAGARVELRVAVDSMVSSPISIPLRYRVTLGRGENARVVEYTDTLRLDASR